MKTEITKEFLESLNLSNDEVNDLFNCNNGSNSVRSGGGETCEYYYAGFLKTINNPTPLLGKKLIQPYNKEIMSIHDEEGWYLTELGHNVISEIIKTIYEPYLESYFFQNDYIKKNVKHIWYCDHINFTLLNHNICQWISFDKNTKQLDSIRLNIGWNIGNLNNLENMIKELEELSLVVKEIQQQLNSIPKEKSFIEIYEQK